MIVLAPSRAGFPNPGELLRYRGLVRLMASRDVKLRFRQTRFGAAWLIVNPLLFTVGYAFLFGGIGRVHVQGHNYVVYTYVGMCLWSSFNAVLNRTGNCLLGNRELLTHAYFPRLVVPLASVLATQVDVLISWAILLGFLLFDGTHLGIGLALVPVWFLLTQTIAMSLGLLVASWTLAFRDLQNITGVVLAMGPVFTPVAYPASALPHQARFLALFNPLTPLFDGMRASAFGGLWPSLPALTFSLIFAFVLVLGSLAIFRRAERSLADVI